MRKTLSKAPILLSAEQSDMAEHPDSMQNRLKKATCTGCAACYNVCPVKAISMREDGEGFLYPVIDEEKCTECALCEKKCPVLSREKLTRNRERPDVYAAWHKNLEIRLQSSSGAAFTALATAVLNKGGRVFGAAFDEDFLVYHKVVDTLEELEDLRRSKYVQSRIGDSLAQAKNELNQGKTVLFSGTPCQIAGFYAYLGQDYTTLFTCSLICKGVPSSKVFRKYLDYLEKYYDSPVISYSFRDKGFGWAPNEAVLFANGEERLSNYFKHETLYYYAFATKSLFLRPSCHTCPFKGLPADADITLADFWSIRNQEPGWDDNKGTSLILINSDKGSDLFEDAKAELVTKLCPFDYIINNSGLMNSPRRPRVRERFFKDLDLLPFELLISKYMTPPHPLVQSMQKRVLYMKTFIKKVIGRKLES